MRVIKTPGKLIYSIKQLKKYLVISFDNELGIYDLKTLNLVRKISTDVPFEFLITVN